MILGIVYKRSFKLYLLTIRKTYLTKVNSVEKDFDKGILLIK